MKLIRPTAELWEQGYTIKDIWKHIARCTRVCYQSTPKNENEDDEDFVRRVIFRNKPDWSEANHLAMLEHGTIYLYVKHDAYNEYEINNFYRRNKYSKCEHIKVDNNIGCCITTNLRVLVENNRLNDLQYLCTPIENHAKRYTICFTTNLGVSREFNRHRVNSIAEESTRYCNYSKDKFGGEITFVVPEWYKGEIGHISTINGDYIEIEYKRYPISNVEFAYFTSLLEAEENYLNLIANGWIPQQAREVLPLATKTQLIHTAFGSDWQHFIKLRSEGVSGAPHPNAKVLGDMVKQLLNGKII